MQSFYTNVTFIWKMPIFSQLDMMNFGLQRRETTLTYEKLTYWKGSSWQLVIVFRYDRFALTVSIETYKKFSQLVSTSDKRPSSGEMKKDQKRVDIYREIDLTPILIKDDLWRLIFTPLWKVDWFMISVIFWYGETFAIKSDMCEHVFTPYSGGGKWRNDTTQFMSRC